MSTPRKYPTLAEFEELKEAVGRIEERMAAKPARPSVWVDVDELAERLGVVDAFGEPVGIGDMLRRIDGERSHAVKSIVMSGAGYGKATVCLELTEGHALTAVDMRLPSHEVTKKATA